MGHLLTTFFWSTSSFSGTAQLNEGPFFVGNVNKFFRAEVRGQVNYQIPNIATGSVTANLLAWGLQQVPHTNAALDVITSPDSDSWMMRRQTGQEDTSATWAPASSQGAIVTSYAVIDDWAGQLAIGGNTDMFLVLKTSTGQTIPNVNTFGTIRVWWA